MVASSEMGVRARRRAEMTRSISEAALDLFERHGSAAATVDQIAQVVDISPRTFFRYFSRKEDAAIWNHGIWTAEQIAAGVAGAAEAVEDGVPLVAALAGSWTHLFDQFEAEPAARARLLRLLKVSRFDTGLQVAGLERDQAILTRLMVELGASVGHLHGPVAVRAASEITLAAYRTTFIEWARLQESGVDVGIREVHHEVVAVLRGAGTIPS